ALGKALYNPTVRVYDPMHVATAKTHSRATRRTPARGRPPAPRRPIVSGRDRSATGRQPDGGQSMGTTTPGPPAGLGGLAEPSHIGSPASTGPPTMAGPPEDPGGRGDPLRFRDRAVDPAQDTRRDRSPLRSELSSRLPLGQAPRTGLVGADPRGP